MGELELLLFPWFFSLFNFIDLNFLFIDASSYRTWGPYGEFSVDPLTGDILSKLVLLSLRCGEIISSSLDSSMTTSILAGNTPFWSVS